MCGRELGPRSRAVTCSSACRKRLHRRGGSSWVRRRAQRWGLRIGDFWRTPASLFEDLDAEFGFVLDAAAAGTDDAKCARYLTPDDNALEQPWGVLVRQPDRLEIKSGAVFVNPPYSQAGGGIGRWVAKALEERQHADVVLVLPSTRTTAWARELLEHADEIRYPTRRIAFEAPPGLEGSAPRHETMIAVLRCGGRGPAREFSWHFSEGTSSGVWLGAPGAWTAP